MASAYTEDADDAMEMSTTISTPSKAIIGEKNKTPASASGISSMNVPPAAVTPETVDKPSTFVPPGDAANKTGFNLENKVGGNLNSFFKVSFLDHHLCLLITHHESLVENGSYGRFE